ncbi:HAD-like protein, partial [Fistulina hepatica ATCC 64428]
STLVDSTPGVLKGWEILCTEMCTEADFAGLTPKEYSLKVAGLTHGRRPYQTLPEYCHVTGTDEELWAAIRRFEDLILEGGSVILPGVAKLVSELNAVPEMANRWTIVTSGSNTYAPRALKRCDIPIPPHGIVCANDVTHGKPHPEPYLAGAKICQVDPKNCLVVEDAPSGIQAGRSAGCNTLAVCTSMSREFLTPENPDYIVTNLSKVSVAWVNGKIAVTIDESLDGPDGR